MSNAYWSEIRPRARSLLAVAVGAGLVAIGTLLGVAMALDGSYKGGSVSGLFMGIAIFGLYPGSFAVLFAGLIDGRPMGRGGFFLLSGVGCTLAGCLLALSTGYDTGNIGSTILCF